MSLLATKPTKFRCARKKEVVEGARRRNSDDWEPSWASYWLAALVGVGCLRCHRSSTSRNFATKAYGLSLQDSQDFPFARVKAARELAAGVVALRGC